MRSQKEEATTLPVPKVRRRTQAAESQAIPGRAREEKVGLPELLASRVVRQALQPLAERILSLPGSVFCIASAESGEGRTLVATALALMLSERTDRNVLLVDANTQRPCIHRLFGVSGSPGLADCLMGESHLQDAVSLVGTLSVLPAGRRNDTRLLFRTGASKRLLGEMGRTHDVTLVDLPPLTPDNEEATALCDWADGTIIVVRANVTKAPDVAKAVKVVEVEKLLGIVLNQEEEELPSWLERLL
jgi:Mrp family chromosome partitioning ATPase